MDRSRVDTKSEKKLSEMILKNMKMAIIRTQHAKRPENHTHGVSPTQIHD